MWYSKLFLLNLATLFYGVTYAVLTADHWTDIALPVGIVVICGILGYLTGMGGDEPYTETVAAVVWLLLIFFAVYFYTSHPEVGPYSLMTVGAIWTGLAVAHKRISMLRQVLWPVFGVSFYLTLNVQWESVGIKTDDLIILIVPMSLITILAPKIRRRAVDIGAILWAIWIIAAIVARSFWMMGIAAHWGTTAMIIFKIADWEVSRRHTSS